MKKMIVKKYKYICFELKEEKPKTKVYNCINNKSSYVIGQIKWFPSWRQYCFYPFGYTVFSKGCLNDITDFINEISRK